MNIEEFMDTVKDKLQSYYGEECDVECNLVTKNNDQVKHGIVIRRKGKSSAPNIYVDEAYEEFTQGKSLESITTELICLRNKCSDEVEFDADLFGDYDWVKDRLGIKLVSRNKNVNLLNDVPHKDFSDMAVLFNVLIDDTSIGKGTILVRNEHMSMWGISTDRLYDDAVTSMMNNDPPVLQDIVDMLVELFNKRKEGPGPVYMGMDKEELKEQIMQVSDNKCLMYVLTNQSKINGASVIVYPGMLKDVGVTMGCDYYLLPSSIHEVIIVPIHDENENGDELSMLVREVNDNKLSPDLVLSDHAYRYHRQTNWLEPLYLERIAEQAC